MRNILNGFIEEESGYNTTPGYLYLVPMHAIKMSDLRESMANYAFPSRSSTPRHSTSESFMSTSFLSKAKHRSVDSYKIDEYFVPLSSSTLPTPHLLNPPIAL